MNNMYIQIIDGPNLNLTGIRQTNIYGEVSINDILEKIRNLNPNIEFRYYQNNSEGNLIDKIHECGYDKQCLGIILNGGAYTHTSIALADAVSAVPATIIEVHISNIYARDGGMRAKSYLSPVCKGSINGFGLESYLLATHALLLDANL